MEEDGKVGIKVADIRVGPKQRSKGSSFIQGP